MERSRANRVSCRYLIGIWAADHPIVRRFQSTLAGELLARFKHHEMLRFSWQMIGGEGTVLLEGMDFGEVGSDGRLQRIVGFFGSFPAIKLNPSAA